MALHSVEDVLDQFTARNLVEKISAQLLAGCPIETADALMRQLAEGELFAPVMRLWVHALKTCRHFSREAAWREAAVERGVEPYEAGRLLAVLWLAGDNAAVQAKAVLMRQKLREVSFARQGDLFHLEKVGEIVDGMEALVAYDDGVIELEDERLVSVHSFIISTLYEGLWQAHNALEGARAARLARLYIRLVGNPELADWAELQFVVANGFAPRAPASAAADADVPEQISWAHRPTQAQAAALLQQRACGGVFDPGQADAFLVFLRGMAQKKLWEGEAAPLLAWLDEAARALAPHVDQESWGLLNGTLSLFRGFALEQLGQAEAADTALRVAASAPVPFLPEEFQQGIDALIARGRRAEARAIMASGVREMRSGFAGSGLEACIGARDSHEAFALGDQGLVLSGWGVGDDILRLGMLCRLKGADNRFAYVLDPRIAPLARRALPSMRFLSASRIGGAGGITRADFWRDREGVPASLPPMRFTGEIHDVARRMTPDLYLGEELLLAWHDSAPVPAATPAPPVLAVSDAARVKARAWLETLPKDRPTICLAWRSGDLGGERARHFFSLAELAPLFAARQANWINVQYGWTEAELDAAAQAGVSLHTMPDLDIRDDFDLLGALMLESTLTVAPRLSTRDFAGALGVRTLSLSVGYPGIEAWRCADSGAGDLVFPSITHLAQRSTDGRAAVIAAAVAFLRKL